MRFDLAPFKTVQDARRWACNEIDDAAGAARARYLTVAAGQEFAYQAKYANAKAYVLAGYPESTVGAYPWVRAEAEATGRTYADVADSIVAAGDPWHMVTGPAIEGARLGAKGAIDGMDGIQAIVVHARQALAVIGGI